MTYITNPRRQNPISFGSRRRGWDGPVRRGFLAGMGDPTAAAAAAASVGLPSLVPSSAGPDPASLYAPPSPLLVQAPVSSNPLNYVSPQQAIAAGVDPGQATAAWTQYVNSFQSVQQAIQAGVAPTVVTDLWAGGAAPKARIAWYKKYAVLLLAGGGAALLMLAGKEEPR
jgi:hypothetical protein